MQTCHSCSSCGQQALLTTSGNPHFRRRQLKQGFKTSCGRKHSIASGQSPFGHVSTSSSQVAPASSGAAQSDSSSIVQVDHGAGAVDAASVNTGLGTQQSLDFLYAWNQLAPHLPLEAASGRAAELLLNAVKLQIACTPPMPIAPQTNRALATALQLADLLSQGVPLDVETVAAGMLSEAVACQHLTLEVVQARLGKDVAILIQHILKVKRLPRRVDLYDDVASSSLRELALTFYNTRAIVAEVVAQWVSMHDLGGTPAYARQLAALEGLQIYAPLGQGLGLRTLCAQLEDRCFQELFPESYAETASWLRREVSANQDSLERCSQQLQSLVNASPEFQALAAHCQVTGRTKSLFSTMKKLLRLDSIKAGGRSREEVHDVLAARCIITPHPDLPPRQAEALAVQACYVAGSVMATEWQELPERRKDYIAEPKANGYRSLHCALSLPALIVECAATEEGVGAEECSLQGEATCELQIRTQRMHEQAESGGAAHAAYKGGLDALQTERIQGWTQALQALPLPRAPRDPPHPTASQDLLNQQAAAEQLFRHLDLDGDGHISMDEVEALLKELGVPSSRLQAAADPQHSSKVTFAEFLELHRQASLMGAVGRVDSETAHSLRLSAPNATPLPQAAPSPTPLPQATHPGRPSLPLSQSDTNAADNLLPAHQPGTASNTADFSTGPAASDAHLPQDHSACCSWQKLSSEVQQGTSNASSAAHMEQGSWEGSLQGMPHSSVSIPFSADACALATDVPSHDAFGPCTHSSVKAFASHAFRGCTGTHSSLRSTVAHGTHDRGRACWGQLSSPALVSWRLHAVPRTAVAEAEPAQPSTADMSQHAGAHTQAAAPSDRSASSRSGGTSQDLADAQDLLQPDDSASDSGSSSSSSSDGSSSSRLRASYDQGASSTILASSKYNQSTVSLDLDDLPPIQLPKPFRSLDVVSSSDEPAVATTVPSLPDVATTVPPLPAVVTSGDELEKYRPPLPKSQDKRPLPKRLHKQRPKRPADGVRQPPLTAPMGSGSWDNLQPLFRPPARADAKAGGPMDPPHEAAEADVLFAAIQNRRYKHVKGTSYKGATFALVPLDRKMGWRMEYKDEVAVGQPMHLPQHGPLLIGAGGPKQRSCDIVLECAEPAGVQARLEVFWKGRKPCCLVTSFLRSNTFINRSKLKPVVDTEAYPGDVISFGSVTCAFQLVPVFNPAQQESALRQALHRAGAHDRPGTSRMAYEDAASELRMLSLSGQLTDARNVMANHLLQSPERYEGWAQLANVERRLAHGRASCSHIPAARCYYRAATQQLHEAYEGVASPNGEAAPGSERHRLLMTVLGSALRTMSSWALMELETRNPTAGRRLFRAALNLVPKDPPLAGRDVQGPVKLLFKWAHQEFSQHNMYQTRELVQELLQLEPDNTRGLSLLGSLELEQGNQAAARRHFEKAIACDPKHVSNYHNLARLELLEGNVAEARGLFAHGLELQPRNEYILQAWALAEAAEGNVEWARRTLRKACQVQPSSVPSWHALAKLEDSLNNTDEARQLFQHTLSLDPHSPINNYSLGALERKAGNLPLALKYLDKAIALNRDHVQSLEEKALVMTAQGKHEEASKLRDRLEIVNKKLERRQIGRKSANDFIRSSQAQQEERRHRLRKQSQKRTRKMAATQKKKPQSAGKKQHAKSPGPSEARQSA